MPESERTNHAQPLPPYLVPRYRGWHATTFTENKIWYRKLAEEGQSPRIMAIACCDSRVNVNGLFSAETGDIFLHRNIANVVPPYLPDGDPHGTSAALEYAVSVLRVAHVIVVGHSDCGGVRGCQQMCSGHAPELEAKESFVGRWLEILRPGYERVSILPTRPNRYGRWRRRPSSYRWRTFGSSHSCGRQWKPSGYRFMGSGSTSGPGGWSITCPTTAGSFRYDPIKLILRLSGTQADWARIHLGVTRYVLGFARTGYQKELTMLIFLRLIAGLLLLVAVLAGVSFVLPREVTVERSTLVAASPEVVFPHVNSLKAMQGWSPWLERTQMFR